jgi:hypothetical protein
VAHFQQLHQLYDLLIPERRRRKGRMKMF